MTHRTLTVVAVASLVAAAAAAQAPVSANAHVGYTGLIHTPVALLPQIPTRTMVGGVPSGVALSLRYGYLGRGERNNKTNAFGVSAVLPAGMGSTVSVTGGFYRGDCPDPECRNILMLGAGGDMRVASMPFGVTGSRVTFTVNGDLGWSAREFDTGYISGHVGLPVALVPGTGSTGMRFAPYVTPGFGFVRASERRSGTTTNHSGSRFTFGGGVAMYNPASSMMFHLGAMTVPVSDGEVMLGAGLAVNW
jgi:opacity protein-like surface antigen